MPLWRDYFGKCVYDTVTYECPCTASFFPDAHIYVTSSTNVFCGSISHQNAFYLSILLQLKE